MATGFPEVSLATYGVGAAAAISHELERELGIEVMVEARSFDDHSTLLDGETPAMWTLAWSADYPHAHDFLGLLLRGDSSANVGGWANEAYDALIDAAASTADPAAQAALYAQAQAIVRDEAPLIPLGLQRVLGPQSRGPARRRRSPGWACSDTPTWRGDR